MKIKTHGKIILIGEHSVVYGKPAIAIPFMDRELELTIKDSNENYLCSDFYNGKIKDLDGRLLGFKNLIKTFTDKYKISDKVKILIKSDIPLQRGMGSSASIAVAIAKGLYEHFKIDYDIDKIMTEIFNRENEKKMWYEAYTPGEEIHRGFDWWGLVQISKYLHQITKKKKDIHS